MHELGHGPITWCAAHHDAGEDAHNPHAMSCSRTRYRYRRKVIGTTTNAPRREGAKENGWRCAADNDGRNAQSMVRAHHGSWSARADVRNDPRSLKKQGIDRVPQFISDRKRTPSTRRATVSRAGTSSRSEGNPYSMIDQESPRSVNARIIETNKQNDPGARGGEAEAPNSSNIIDPALATRKGRELREAQDRRGLPCITISSATVLPCARHSPPEA